MIVTRFRSVTYVAGVATAALCCYLVSQSVAAERAGLARIDRQITATQSDISRLRTEIATRSRMGQLDRWNTDVLALQAPNARQFLASETQLAGLNAPHALPLDPDVAASKGAVELAAYHAPAAASQPERVAPAAEPQPLLRVATYVRPQTDRLGSGVSDAPLVRTALEQRAPAKPAVASRIAPPKPAAAARSSLLPDDIDSLAAAEHKAKSGK